MHTFWITLTSLESCKSRT